MSDLTLPIACVSAFLGFVFGIGVRRLLDLHKPPRRLDFLTNNPRDAD